jgi:protein TilB
MTTCSRSITLELIRKRSEHNAGLVSTLEELALHQEELQSIGSIIGRTCGKTLKILLLQNNVIERMVRSELKYFKSLEYLNLALNNIRCIEQGSLSGMECLKKLDLTLNFIDLDHLESSIDELGRSSALQELFLIGNPCMGTLDSDSLAKKESNKGWSGCRAYIIAKLPNLRQLDGHDIKRSEKITAAQQLPALQAELRERAQHCSEERQLREEQDSARKDDDDSSYIADEAKTQHNPETRTKISNEVYDQKMAKEKQASENTVKQKGEKEWEEEHKDTVQKARALEDDKSSQNDKIKQCNQGKYNFWFEEERSSSSNSGVKSLILHVDIPKHLSTSLIDVDIHPNHVVVIIKNKILRLILPVEVSLKGAIARRSAVSGNLELVMPKMDPNEIVVGIGLSSDNMRSRNASVKAKAKSSSRSNTATKNVLMRKRENLGKQMMEEVNNYVNSEDKDEQT